MLEISKPEPKMLLKLNHLTKNKNFLTSNYLVLDAADHGEGRIIRRSSLRSHFVLGSLEQNVRSLLFETSYVERKL